MSSRTPEIGQRDQLTRDPKSPAPISDDAAQNHAEERLLRTARFWQPYDGRELTLEDARQVQENLTVFVITEGFHNKMETLSRQAYGFRNFEYYRQRVQALCA